MALPPWLGSALRMMIFVAGGLFLGWLTGRGASLINLDFDLNLRSLNFLEIVIVPILLLIFALAAHELGHLIGGWLVGFRFMLFIVGPLKIAREGEAVRVRLNKDIFLYGGLASAMPTDDRDLPRRLAVIIAGGPLTSLLLGLISLGLFIWLNTTIPAESLWSSFTFYALVFGFGNLALFVATSLPGKTSGFDTDGAQLLDALRGGHRAERKWLMAAIVAASTDGVRPRYWKAEYLERLLALREGGPDDVMLNYLGYYHFLDVGQIRRAGGLLDLCLEQAASFPPAVRPMLFAEAAYFHAFHQHNASAARQFLPSATGGMLEAHTRLRAEAAVLLAEGRFVESVEKARAGLAGVEKSWDKGGALAEQEWLAEIVHRAEAQAAEI